MHQLSLTVALILGLATGSPGQAIDNMASVRMIDGDRYVRLHYENDFFTATDYYYTQGINLEFVHPSLARFPLSKVLIGSKRAGARFGLALEHNGFTPTSIEHEEILVGDRPFAAALMLKAFAMSNVPAKRLRITSALTLGIIGPAAKGYEMQKTIHEWIHDTRPLGWQNQIQNDVVVDYEASAEKRLFNTGRILLVNAYANARVGTLSTRITSGLTLMAGGFNQAIKTAFGIPFDARGDFDFHFYFQPLVNLVGYDATLQGGMFNKSSPYTISSGEISRITLQGNFGVVLRYRAVNVEYFKSMISKEFESGMNHSWGGIRVGVRW
jgi:lipid A 3-O-deacylase